MELSIKIALISFLSLPVLAQTNMNGPTTGGWEKTTDAANDMERNEDWKNTLEKKSLDKRASPGFVARFKIAQQAIEKGDLKKAEENLQKLHAIENFNPYEKARLHLIDYWYAGKVGDKEKETQALELLIPMAFGKIDSEAFVEAGIRLLKRQYNSKNYGGAIDTLNALKQDPASMSELNLISSAVTSLEAMQSGSQNVSHKVTVDATGVWKAKLIHHYFYINNIEGRVKTVDFACENKAATINFQPDSVMATQEAWGACTITVNVDANTKFDLVELVKKPE